MKISKAAVIGFGTVGLLFATGETKPDEAKQKVEMSNTEPGFSIGGHSSTDELHWRPDRGSLGPA
jgi:hypothetical protein